MSASSLPRVCGISRGRVRAFVEVSIIDARAPKWSIGYLEKKEEGAEGWRRGRERKAGEGERGRQEMRHRVREFRIFNAFARARRVNRSIAGFKLQRPGVSSYLFIFTSATVVPALVLQTRGDNGTLSLT